MSELLTPAYGNSPGPSRQGSRQRPQPLNLPQPAVDLVPTREHPRDLFDVMELFAHGSITPEIRRAFVVYLACHNRTIYEVLFPAPKDIHLAYEGSFVGMTTEPVKLEALLETRERLFRELPAALDAKEREFLQTLARAQPDWTLLDIPHLEELPAIQWRLQNLEQLSRSQPDRFRALADEPDTRLGRAYR